MITKSSSVISVSGWALMWSEHGRPPGAGARCREGRGSLAGEQKFWCFWFLFIFYCFIFIYFFYLIFKHSLWLIFVHTSSGTSLACHISLFLMYIARYTILGIKGDMTVTENVGFFVLCNNSLYFQHLFHILNINVDSWRKHFKKYTKKIK